MTEEKEVKIYREVKCSDRLPEKDGSYFIILKNSRNDKFDLFLKTDSIKYWNDVEYWLEPIEIKVIEVEESDSKKILPKEERLSGTEITDLKDGILEAQLMYKYIKALESAELKNILLQDELNILNAKYNTIKEVAYRRKEQIDLLTSDANERYNKAISYLKEYEDENPLTGNKNGMISISNAEEALKIGIYGK